MDKLKSCQLCGSDAETGTNVIGNLGARCSRVGCVMHSKWLQSQGWNNNQIESMLSKLEEENKYIEHKLNRERQSISWRDITRNLDDVYDGLLKAAMLAGAWAAVSVLIIIAYGVGYEAISGTLFKG